MPSRNTIKQQLAQSYYHVYARGGNKQKIFLDAADSKYFLHLFDRYLSEEAVASKDGTLYPHYFDKINILAYCLMGNHFHLLIYQEDVPYLEKFMRSLLTSYSRYFNRKYKRTGPVFESRYKAIRIEQDAYLQHITRYIHLNPRFWERHKFSSLRYYRGAVPPVWLDTSTILALFGSSEAYLSFVADYQERRDLLQNIRKQLELADC